jgi:hypothetical protein
VTVTEVTTVAKITTTCKVEMIHGLRCVPINALADAVDSNRAAASMYLRISLIPVGHEKLDATGGD